MEKIIYSDTLNQTELLRTLAKRGIKTFGLRVMSSYDLALFILSKLGRTEKRRYLPNQEQDFIYYSLLNPNSFNDASNIRSAINSFRDTGNGNSYSDIEPFLDKTFSKKLNTIKEAFTKYNQYKKDNNLYDLYDLLYELEATAKKINDVEVSYYKDLPYSPTAIQTFSAFFDLKQEEFANVFNKEEQTYSPEVVKCYGKNNEFAYVLNTIRERHLNLDECLIILTNSGDITGLVNRFDLYNIPYTASIGYPFGQTNVGRLVAKLHAMKNMAYGVDAYRGLFAAPYFKKENYTSLLGYANKESDFIKAVGWLRPNFDDDEVFVNQSLFGVTIIKALQKVCTDINNGEDKYYEFIKNNVADDKYNFEALQLLERYLNICHEYQIPFDVVVNSLLSSTISQHISQSGCIHVSSFQQAFSTLREHIFIIGLDSDFPGNPKENYLIYDDEYKAMGADKYVSSKVVMEKERLMNMLINNLAHHTYLSYSYYNVIDTKIANPSSIIYHINSGDIPEFSWENDKLSINSDLIDYYNRNALSDTQTKDNSGYKYDPQVLLDKAYSPSSFGDFFNNKLAFVFQNIFGIYVEEPDDPYVVINPSDKGTLFHDLMKGFNKKDYKNEQEFVDKGLRMFDDFMQSKPPIIAPSQAKERSSFEKGLRIAYQSDPGNTCVLAEEKITDCVINGIKFTGKFDRLEKDATGKYIVVDYKTGTSMHHSDDDPLSCIQGLIYAAMIEKEYGYKIEYCEFRYPFANGVAKISYDTANRAKVIQMIDEFKTAIKNHDFACLEDEYDYVDKYEHLISLMKELKR